MAEPHDLNPDPVVQFPEPRFQRPDLQAVEYPGRLLYVTEPARVRQDDPHQLRRHAVRRELVLDRHLFDVPELVLRRDLADRQELNAVLLSLRRTRLQRQKREDRQRIVDELAQQQVRVFVGAVFKLPPLEVG